MVQLSSSLSTILVISTPFLLPRLFAFVSPFIFPKPVGTRTPLQPSQNGAGPAYLTRPQPPPVYPSTTSVLWRLLLLTLAAFLSLFTALLPSQSQNVFLALAPPRTYLQKFISVLRTPIDIRTPTEIIARQWGSHSRLSDAELTLLNHLQSLDSRLLYLYYGPTPLLSCTWCRKLGSADLDQVAADYFLFSLPAMMLSYLAVMGVLGLMTREKEGRSWSRKWLGTALGVGFLLEAAKRGRFEGVSGGKIFMVHSRLLLIRYFSFAILLVTTYVLPAQPLPSNNPLTAISAVTPSLHGIASRIDFIKERIRASGLQRMAVMHKKETRGKLTQFWQSAETESSIAHLDPIVRSSFETQFSKNDGTGTSEEAEGFRTWVKETTKGVVGEGATGVQQSTTGAQVLGARRGRGPGTPS